MNTQELIDQILLWVVDQGKNRSQVTELILSHSSSEISEKEVNTLLGNAFKKLSENYADESDPFRVINLHVAIYEHIYSYFRSIRYTSGVNKSLQGKERLLNIIKEGNKMTFKKTDTVIYTHNQPVLYDFLKLSENQRNRLEELVNEILIQ